MENTPANRSQPAGEPVLQVRGLKKSFVSHLSLGRSEVLKGIDFNVNRGEIYGLLGPNGAGKTTTLKLILGLLRPDAGTVRLLGRPSTDPASRRKVGFLPENPYFYDYLTAREFLDFYARLLDLPAAERRRQIEDLLLLVGLHRAPDTALRKFSKGMVQRVGMAQALLGDPDLVILDEPMSGLDPIGRRRFRDIILALREKGKTVCFSSHILQDAELICDRVGILKDGRLVREGDLGSLLGAGERGFEVRVEADSLPRGDGWRTLASHRRETLLRVDGSEALESLLGALAACGAKLIAVTPLRQSLEDLFLEEIEGPRPAAPRDLAAARLDG